MTANPYGTSALRKNVITFLSGKFLSAALTFAILLLVVRVLPVEQYAAYVTLIASMELGYAIAQLGLSWMAARYLPEYLLNARGKVLIRYCIKLLVWQSLSLAAFLCLFSLMLGKFLIWSDLGQYQSAAKIVLVILFVEGVGKFCREGMLGPLMQQGAIRFSMILRQFIFLSILVFQSYDGDISLHNVVCFELIASGMGSTIAVLSLVRILFLQRGNPGNANWEVVASFHQWKLALQMYSAHLMALTYSPQILINILQKSAGPEATALFGFLRSLIDQVSRYLPATLLFSIVRPKLVATSVSNGNQEMIRLASTIGKLSLLLLFPLLAVSAGWGEQFVNYLSGGKFTDSAMALFGFLLVLIPYSQRHLLETVAVILERSWLCNVGGLCGMLVLPLMFWLLSMGLGISAAIISIGVGYLLFNGVLVIGLMRTTMYTPDLFSISRLLLAFSISVFVSLMMSTMFGRLTPFDSATFLLGTFATIFSYFAVLWLMNPFNEIERKKINDLTAKRVFTV